MNFSFDFSAFFSSTFSAIYSTLLCHNILSKLYFSHTLR
jgi:hypothetical protein